METTTPGDGASHGEQRFDAERPSRSPSKRTPAVRTGKGCVVRLRNAFGGPVRDAFRHRTATRTATGSSFSFETLSRRWTPSVDPGQQRPQVRDITAASALLGGVGMYYDLVASCGWPAAPLCQRESAAWMWRGLRQMFPNALAAALMPNHLHVLAPLTDPARTHQCFRRLLGAFARSFEIPLLWKRVPEPEPVATTDKLLRKVRYITLNPCRPFHFGEEVYRLARDPLDWEWSTHRDAVGAIAHPWVTAQAIVEAARVRTDDPVLWLHRYVSGDPHVAVEGTPLPVAGLPTDLTRAAAAALAAHRAAPSDLRTRGPARAAFLGLARSAGLDLVAAAQTAGVATRAARLAVEPPAAALLCAGDERLSMRTSWDPPAHSRALGVEALRTSSHGAPRGLHRAGRFSVRKEK